MTKYFKHFFFCFLTLFFLANQTRVKKNNYGAQPEKIVRAPRPLPTTSTGATSLLPSVDQAIAAVVAQQLQAAENSGAIATTASNLGTGAGIFANKTGSSLNFKSLKAGTNVTLTPTSDAVTITASNSGGDVTGPSSATNSAIALFNDTTGKVIKNSSATIDGSGNVIFTGSMSSTGASITGTTGITGATTITGGALTLNSDSNTYTLPTTRGTSGQVLKLNDNAGTVIWGASGGSGDVVGPSSATNTAIALFDSTTGKLIKNSTATIDGSGNTILGGTLTLPLGSSSTPSLNFTEHTSSGLYFQESSLEEVGNKVQVNESSHNAVRQTRPTITFLSDNSAFVSWATSNCVYLRRVDSSGSPIGSDIQINSTNANQACVGVLSDNSALVVFGGGSNGIMVRKVDSSGTPITEETQISSSQTNAPLNIAILSDNSGLATWIDRNTVKVYVHKIGADGTPMGSDAQVDSSHAPSNTWSSPCIAKFSDDSALITWPHTDNPCNIYMHKINSSGSPIGDDILINNPQASASTCSVPITSFSDDSALAIWIGISNQIYARKINSSSSPVGDNVQVSTTTASSCFNINMAHYMNNTALITWITEVTPATPYIRQINSSGTATENEIPIDSLNTIYNAYTAIGVSAENNSVLVACTDYTTDETAPLYMQRFTSNPAGIKTTVAGTDILNVNADGCTIIEGLDLTGTATITGNTYINTTGARTTNIGNASSAVYSLSVLNNTGSGTTVDVLAGTGQLVAHSSSRRFKENIKPVDDYGAAITQLNPVSFSYKNDKCRTKQFGLIAEEVEQVIPELVTYDKDGLPFSVKYSDLTTLLLYEVQKQQKTITVLSEEIADLKKPVRPE